VCVHARTCVRVRAHTGACVCVHVFVCVCVCVCARVTICRGVAKVSFVYGRPEGVEANPLLLVECRSLAKKNEMKEIERIAYGVRNYQTLEVTPIKFNS